MKMEFLKYAEIETLITSTFPNERAEIIANVLKDHVIIIATKKSASLYMIQSNITYQSTTTDVKTHLMPTCTKLIEDSFKALSKCEQELIKTKFVKTFAFIFTSSAVSQYYNELYVRLVNTRITWDKTLCEIHFNNGYMDLNDLKFKPRQMGEHYITHFIDRDYKASSKAQQEAVLKPVRQVYPIIEDMNCITMSIGSALSGLSQRDQDTLFLLGQGSSGKSFILQLTEQAIGCYFKEMKNDTFSQSNNHINKILNTYQSNPQIRISWVNEMEDTKIDASLFKTFCDGKLTTTVLYEDGSFSVEHFSKAVITANTMPNIKVDTGVSRRFRGYTHKSSFTDNKQDVNEKENVYFKNKGLLDELVKQNLMNAWFDILAHSCHSWLKGEAIAFTDNFDETKDSVILTNDWIQDFIDVNLIITNNPVDRIGKSAMHDALRVQYPNKHLSPLQLLTCLKDKKVKYDPKLRCEKVQGCYTCVKFQNDDDSNEDTNSLDGGIQAVDYKMKYEALMIQYEELKQKHIQEQDGETESESDDDEMDNIATAIFNNICKKK